MCVKVANSMECYKCGYPWSEARWPDELGIRCDATQAEYNRATAPHMAPVKEVWKRRQASICGDQGLVKCA
jgi:hypothetical protein